MSQRCSVKDSNHHFFEDGRRLWIKESSNLLEGKKGTHLTANKNVEPDSKTIGTEFFQQAR
jgi:hypothetical protein